jgi:hypothetical protein
MLSISIFLPSDVHVQASSTPASQPGKKPAKASSTSGDEKKEDGNSADDKKKKKSVPFSKTPALGGSGGTEFDHGNHIHIDEITIAADKNMVHGISVKYRGAERKNGSVGKDNTKTFKLRPGEFITSAKVTTSSHGAVTSLTLFTNRGGKLGPCGDEKGRDELVKAPDGAVLCGFHGRAGRHINAIGFKWGPNPKV